MSALACLQAGAARAQELEAPPQVAPAALSFTVSGGVSLGAFEAGVVYLLTEAVKRSGGEVALRIATGASAGSANSLIALMESCMPEVEDPTLSMGYETWVPVGIQQLFVASEVGPTSILSRAPLVAAMKRVEARWRQGLRADCDVVLGVSVTRRKPQLVDLTKPDLGPAVQVPRSSEKFVLRIQGRGAGRVPILRNYVDPSSPLAQPLLPLTAAEDDASQLRNFERLLGLLYASAAFPLAFAPFELEFCETEPRWVAGKPGAVENPLVCEHPQRAQFIDGGLFDNAPLRLNYRIVQHSLREDASGRGRWLEYSEPRDGQPPPMRFAYIDPNTGSYPALDRLPKIEGKPSAVDLVFELAGDFVETSRRRELLALLEDTSEGPDPREHMYLTQNQLPPVANQLGAFFGFFEWDFRALDFYLGMYDGLVSVRRMLEGNAGSEAVAARLANAFPVLAIPMRKDLSQGMLPFACLLSQIEPAFAGHAAACDGDALRNFRILLQVTLDRLHGACRLVEEHELPPQASPLCFAAARGKPRVQVRGVKPLDAAHCARFDGEPDFDYTLRLLGEYGFAYHDLGLTADQSRYGKVKIRRRILSMADALADAQPTTISEALVAATGRAGANRVVYEPPRSWFYVTAGTAIEAGASLLPFSWNESWARLNLALQISHWETLATPERLTLAFTPLIGPEFELLFLSNSIFQVMLGTRAGYKASWRDAAGASDCSPRDALEDARNCSQLVLHGYVATAFVERLRTQFAVEYFPMDNDVGFKSRIAFQLSFGLQFF